MNDWFHKLSGYCLALLLCVGLPYSYGQPHPFEGANVILINTDLADKEAYLAIGRVLTEQAIPFSAASDCLLINAKGQPFDGYKDVVFVGQLSVNAGLVKLTGRMRMPVPVGKEGGSDNYKAVGYSKEKSKPSLSRAGFLYLNGLAKKLYPELHGVISYKVQPEPME
jgi:hypothetical protein